MRNQMEAKTQIQMMINENDDNDEVKEQIIECEKEGGE